MTPPKRLATAALLTALLAVPAPPSPAQAAGLGSIVYVKQNNVWIMRGDGTGARRVTSDGTTDVPYVSPTESRAGVIAVGHGGDIVRMDQRGAVLSSFDAPMLQNSVGENMDGHVSDLALSPNGSKVAWTFVRYTCAGGGGTDCTIRYATGYSASDHYRRVGRPVFFNAPSWVSEKRTLSFGGFGEQVMLHDLAAPAVHWFDDSDYTFPDTDLGDGDLSPDGHWLALIRGFGTNAAVAWYAVTGSAVTGPPPPVPDIRCASGGQAGHADPTWAPNSRGLAWAGDLGVYLQIDATQDCGSTTPAHLVARGGTDPDWSAAPLTGG